MSITIYDTQSGEKKPLQPMEAGHVRMYVCGITAYDYCHIGHARSALAFDMIYRYLLYRGYQVTYIRNFTDIDDKIINRAHELETTPEELSERFIRAFHDDMEVLGVAPPSLEPKATGHVGEIIAMIEELIDKGLAYQVDGDVYYVVDRFPAYGRLSKRTLEDMEAGARISINEKKNNPMDFALWKSSKPGEPTWESPWGPGRPGWHIECSAMSRKYLGDSFDIHGGGKDLIFPHHENEIAQSEGATGKPFVNTWIHHGFVTIKEEKMSKSLGNFLTIRDVLSQYHPEALRLFVFSSHYRTPLSYSDTAMQEAEAALNRFYSCLSAIMKLSPADAPGTGPVASEKDRKKIDTLAARFTKSMDNDFNTAQGLAHLFDIIKTLNKILRLLPPAPARPDVELLKKGAGELRVLAGIMGFLREDPAGYMEKKRAELLDKLDIDADTIRAMIRERDRARMEKDWARGDAIRAELLARQIELQDGPEGTTWDVKV